MTARLRLVLPPLEFLAVGAFCFLVFQAFRYYIEWKQGAPCLPGEGILRFGEVLLCMTAIGHGMFRVVGFHPFYRPGYRAWLERTPWTSRKPLPMGPIALVWEDGVMLSVLALLTQTLPGVDPWRLLAFLLLTYLAFLALTLQPTGEPAYAYLLAFGMGLMVRLFPYPVPMLVTGLLVYGAGALGLRRSLGRFPWTQRVQNYISLTSADALAKKQARQQFGWPYDRLGPSADPPVQIDSLNALLLSMLVGWWLFALEAVFTNPRDALLLHIGVFAYGTFGLVLGRLARYVVGYAPPISLWGRLWTLRWIVPGYDQVFLGPLCTLVLPPLSVYLLWRNGLRGGVYLPVCCGLALFTALSTLPRLRRWRLTGRHRLVPGLARPELFTKVS